jgi:hypothetical protein
MVGIVPWALVWILGIGVVLLCLLAADLLSSTLPPMGLALGGLLSRWSWQRWRLRS